MHLDTVSSSSDCEGNSNMTLLGGMTEMRNGQDDTSLLSCSLLWIIGAA